MSAPAQPLRRWPTGHRAAQAGGREEIQPGRSLGDAAARLVGGHDDIGDRTRQEPLGDGERDQLGVGARCRQHGLGAGAPVQRQQLGPELTQPVLDLNRGPHSPPEQRAGGRPGPRGSRARVIVLAVDEENQVSSGAGAMVVPVPAAAGEWIGPDALVAAGRRAAGADATRAHHRAARRPGHPTRRRDRALSGSGSSAGCTAPANPAMGLLAVRVDGRGAIVRPGR